MVPVAAAAGVECQSVVMAEVVEYPQVAVVEEEYPQVAVT
jgi:hypothetical protein